MNRTDLDRRRRSGSVQPLSLTRVPELFFFMLSVRLRPDATSHFTVTPLSSAAADRREKRDQSRSTQLKSGREDRSLRSAPPLLGCWSSACLCSSPRCSLLLLPGSAALWPARSRSVGRCPVTPPPSLLLLLLPTPCCSAAPRQPHSAPHRQNPSCCIVTFISVNAEGTIVLLEFIIIPDSVRVSACSPSPPTNIELLKSFKYQLDSFLRTLLLYFFVSIFFPFVQWGFFQISFCYNFSIRSAIKTSSFSSFSRSAFQLFNFSPSSEFIMGVYCVSYSAWHHQLLHPRVSSSSKDGEKNSVQLDLDPTSFIWHRHHRQRNVGKSRWL